MPDPPASTPLLEQYEGVKARYPGHLVLFRVGDFYETFGEDARLLARELEIVLTARSADANGVRTPMAGVPHHAVESYLARLVERGHKVAICDQVEDARLAKGLVRREVTRVVTPGTTLEDRLLPGPDSNYLACVVGGIASPARLAAVDVSTGEWYRGTADRVGPEALVGWLAPLAPRELLVALDGPSEPQEAALRALRHEFPRIRIDSAPGPVAPSEAPRGLPVGTGGPEVEADLRLVAYVQATQPKLLPYLDGTTPYDAGAHLALDARTLRHLEIARPMNPDDPGAPTLLKLWDETRTAPGHRTIAFWLKHPLREIGPIVARQDAVAWLVEQGTGLLPWRREIERFADVARIAARVAARRVRAVELGALRESLRAVAALRTRLTAGPDPPARLRQLAGRIDPIEALSGLLDQALPEEVPPESDRLERFRPGYAPSLDQARAEEAEGLRALETLERSEQEATGIRSLRIGYTQVFGYYFEVSRPNLAKVPAHFRRKQTLAGGERFTSEALGEIEARLLTARDAADHAAVAAWETMLARIEAFVPALYRMARAVGEIDALLSFAHVAIERGHVRPVVDGSRQLLLREARHPVLDRTLAGRFVPNDTELDGEDHRLLVLTGPNMSGKSTYMRQIGLHVVLAQSGAWVPARYALVGLVSGLATRMGFTDEIGRGKSSFMVEMSEVAEILAGADDRSLVLLDEVGRGTSTFDGLALAWATLRHLATEVRCRTVLATHYHQLTGLVDGLPGARLGHMAAREERGTIVLLHRLVPGSSDRSFGIHVARLAGLPPPLLAEAERLLRQLEGSGPALGPARRRPAATRYTQAVLLPAPGPSAALEAELRALDPDRLAPLDALRWIVEARRRIGPARPEEAAR